MNQIRVRVLLVSLVGLCACGGGGEGADAGPGDDGGVVGNVAEVGVGGAAGGVLLGTGGAQTGSADASSAEETGGVGGTIQTTMGGAAGAVGPIGGTGGLGGERVDASVPIVPIKKASLSPLQFEFGESAVGQAGATKAFAVLNEGNVDLGSITAQVEGSSAFVAGAGKCAGTLKPGAFCNVSVQFIPTTVGELNASLKVSVDGNILLSATLKGTSIEKGQLVLTPNKLDFESTDVGVQPRRLDYSVRNPTLLSVSVKASLEGDADAFRHNFVINGFGTASTPCNLPPGGSCTGSLLFAPKTNGSKVLRVVLDGGTAGKAVLPVSGEAIGGTIKFDPPSHDFGNVVLGSNISRTFTLSVADLPSGIRSGVLQINPSGLKLLADSCTGKTFASGDSCSITISPPAAADREGEMTIPLQAKAEHLVTGRLPVKLQATLPPADSYLLGFWPFNKTLADESGKGHSATAVNGPSIFSAAVEPGFTPGKLDFAYNSALAWAKVANFAALDEIADNASLSVSLWVKSPGTDDVPKTFLSLPNSTEDDSRFAVGSIGLRWRVSVGTWVYVAPSNFSVGWHHVVATLSGAQLVRLYIDGVLLVETYSHLFSSQRDATPVMFGAELMKNGQVRHLFDGALDHVRLYSRSLTESEVKSELNR